MQRLPERPDLGHLKKQAKDLLAAYRIGDAGAISRFREFLPAAARDGQVSDGHGWRLHDAQSCVARQYGFPSWRELTRFVIARRARSAERSRRILDWLHLVYPGETSGGMNRASPAAAARMLEEEPDLPGGDPYLACAVGNAAALRDMTQRDAGWVDRPGGPLGLPPLVAVTHSGLNRLPGFRDRLHACARLLLDAGADPDQAIGSRWPPASVEHPSEKDRLSSLYGAAGQHRDPVLTKLLLDAGANPNDGESLYHSLENPACTKLLLEAGARVAGSNALYRALDLDSVEILRLLLASGADANEPAGSEPTAEYSRALLWAIRRGRSAAHIEALLSAGADPAARTRDGTSAHALALRFGLPEVARLLGGTDLDTLSAQECFVAACAAGDEAAARSLASRHPGLPQALSPAELCLLPELAALGRREAVELMVRLGWPIATRGGDWDASALNHAVFRGDADLARFLLEQGASWEERHGFGDNACGTLSWASLNEPEGEGDWLGCAAALVAHGMPAAQPDPEGSDSVIVDGGKRVFSDEVADFLLAAGLARPAGRDP